MTTANQSTSTSGVREGQVDLLTRAYDGSGGLRRGWCVFGDLQYALSRVPCHVRDCVQQGDVLDAERLQHALNKAVAADPALSLPAARQRAASIFNNMKSRISTAVIRLIGYVLIKLFRRMYARICVHEKHLDEIRQLADQQKPVVYLPLHKSHMDYTLLTWICFHFDLPLMHIASGDNLNLSGMGWFLRRLGAFFIRRRLEEQSKGRDHIYRAVLQSYLHQLLVKCQSIEFYLEGTRSRAGKPVLPKAGLVSVVVDAVNDGSVDDVILLPCSVSYERLIEGSFTAELQGRRKQRESVASVFCSMFTAVFGTSYGFAVVQFAKPIYLKSYMKRLEQVAAVESPSEDVSYLFAIDSGLPAAQALCLSPSSDYNSADLPSAGGGSSFSLANFQQQDARRRLISNICVHVLAASEQCTAVTVGACVSALLLARYRRGVYLDILCDDVEWLLGTCGSRGRTVLDERADRHNMADAVQTACRMICADGIKVRPDADGQLFVQLNLDWTNALTLLPHKNSLLTLFAMEAVISWSCNSASMSVLSFGPADAYQGYWVCWDDLMQRALLICQLMRLELILCHPEQNMEKVLNQAVNRLSSTDSGSPAKPAALFRRIKIIDESLLKDFDHPLNSRTLPQMGDTVIQVNADADHNRLAQCQFYACLLQPLIESYHRCFSYVLQLTDSLIQNNSVSNIIYESAFMQQLLHSAPAQPINANNTFVECLNADSMTTAVRWLCERRLLGSATDANRQCQLLLSNAAQVQQQLSRLCQSVQLLLIDHQHLFNQPDSHA